ncbi:MAG: phosphoribosylformylglycinamidine cyclo-ligase [Candidatus Aminicenantes bacterium]|nr:phosphoribosylformylglycinamidine cyclo-ligase [Candidatus Aminicenantes bacterium]
MTSLTYKKAGVDIDKADEFVKRIKPLLEKTGRPEVFGRYGGFSGFFKPHLRTVKKPVLVSSTDGVGTKLLLAELRKKYDTIGIDLVAMCVNDVVVTGAEPLFFLDYIACGKLEREKLLGLMKGISRGCVESGCVLIGGETAELPGLYRKGTFDLAGFCVGIVSEEKIIDGLSCRSGDRVLGLASTGVHSNGFSLVRKVFDQQELRGKLGQELLRPTRIYVRPILDALRKIHIKAMAHITGGGFYENIPRVLPDGLSAVVQKGSWPILSIFKKIQQHGRIADREMFRTFNMGVGMVIVIDPRSVSRALSHFAERGMKAWDIGRIVKGNQGVQILD